jgi:molybdenum storage protein
MIELLTKKLLNTNLEDPDLLLGTERYKSNKILPEANVIKIGGQSFMDRGRKAVFPLIEEINTPIVLVSIWECQLVSLVF